MLKACLDTSTNIATFTLFRNGEEVVSLSEECFKGASKLLPFINKKILESGVKIHEIQHWKVGVGPGSFTGMRVGIAYVKGICYASGASFEGVNSGFGYIFHLIEQKPTLDKITVLHDGRRQEVICNTFEKSDGVWNAKETEVLPISELCQNGERLGAFVSNMNSELFPDDLRDSVFFIDSINASYFGCLDDRIMGSVDDMDISCEPIYVRPPVFVNPVSK